MTEQKESQAEQGIRRLYQATRREEPSTELDARILHLARQAISARRPRWLVSVATAAVLVLGLTLTLHVVEPPQWTPEEESAPPAPASLEYAPRVSAPVLQAEPKKLEQRMFDRRQAPATSEYKEWGQESATSAFPAASPKRDDAGGPAMFEADEVIAPLGNILAPAKPLKMNTNPEQWLKEIERLLDQGELPQVREALLRFRAEYPDHPIPERLRPWLPPQ